jgi:hypothetical protein
MYVITYNRQRILWLRTLHAGAEQDVVGEYVQPHTMVLQPSNTLQLHQGGDHAAACSQKHVEPAPIADYFHRR